MRHPICCALFCVVAIALALAPSACSSKIPTYPTRGKVVFKDTGKPVGGGLMIWFESTTPPYHRSCSQLDENGEFDLGFIHAGAGAPEGEHRIRLEVLQPGGASAPDALAARMHRRYYEYGTSGLKQTIAKSDNQVVIEVEGPDQR